MSTTSRNASIALLILALVPGGLLAAGFGVYEQSAKASGLAGAWIARADDAAANWYNPAALVWLDGSELQLGTNLVSTRGSRLISSDPAFGLFQPTALEQEPNLVTPSHVYYRRRVNPHVAFGIGVNNPFGLVTEWRDRPVTFLAARSEMVSLVFNPNVAIRLTGTWSVAAGLDYIAAEITSFSREVPIDLDGNPRNGFEVVGFSDLTGDGDAFGWNLAVHHKRDRFSFGATYRSDLTVGIEGEIAFSDFGPLSPLFRNSPARADLELPESFAVGVAWAGEPWGFELDAVETLTSVFDTLEIDLANNVPGFVDDLAFAENWSDSLAVRLGVWRKVGRRGELRFGLAVEEGVVPPETLRPSIPDAGRTVPAIGYGFLGRKWAVDLYAQVFFFDDATAVPGEVGVLVADYDSNVALLGITVGRRW